MPNWLILVLVGAVSLLAGLIALLFPLPASLTLNAFVGTGLLLAGALGAWAALRGGRSADRLWGLALGVAVLALGLILLLSPEAGLKTMTLVLAIGFLVSGILKLLLGWQLPVPAWKWSMLLSGLISVGLALIIFSGFPESAAVVPGLLLAVELLSYGWGLIFLGLAAKQHGGRLR